MRKLTLGAAFAALLLGAVPATAHHSFSKDFDRDKPVTLTGTVTKVQWTAPHVYTWIDVKDDQGKVTNWKVELGNPTALTKAGWTRDKLKMGEMVTLQGWRAKNGSNFANAEEMTINGQKLSAASSYDSSSRGAVATSGRKTPKSDGGNPKTPSSPKY
jgi:hypothetical protein